MVKVKPLSDGGIGQLIEFFGWLPILAAVFLFAYAVLTTAAVLIVSAGTVFFCGVSLLAAGRALRLLSAMHERLCKAEENTRYLIEAPKAESEQAMYYYQAKGDIRGPVSLLDLKTMRNAPMEPRLVSGSTLVCLQGTQVWQPLTEVAGVRFG